MGSNPAKRATLKVPFPPFQSRTRPATIPPMNEDAHLSEAVRETLYSIGVELLPELAHILPKRKPGGQRGNQNARKHGFYSKRMSPEQLREFKAALKISDMSHEIALLRIRLKSLLNDPDASPDLIHKTVNSITKLTGIQRHNSRFR